MNSNALDRRAHPEGAVFSAWQADDGWSIRRMEWPQQPGGEVRGSLLFAGGRGDFIEKYLEALRHWHSRGWNVTAFDWRGQGASSGDIVGGHLESFEPLVRDAAALLAVWTRGGPGPHVAIGHSMGGHLLLRLIVEARPPLSAAVLVAPMIDINASPLSTWMARGAARVMCAIGFSRRRAWKDGERPSPPGSVRQSFLTSCPERYSDELWWYEQQPGYRLGAPSWGWLNAAYRSIAALTEDKLRSCDLPILLLGTERDRLVSPAAIRRAAALLPEAELMMFDDAGHEILREADAVRLQALAKIDSFLAVQA